jgi:hypothetical protein
LSVTEVNPPLRKMQSSWNGVTVQKIVRLYRVIIELPVEKYSLN